MSEPHPGVVDEGAPYRASEVQLLCSECGAPGAAAVCRRCDRLFCSEHRPRPRCSACEESFQQQLARQLQHPSPSWFPFAWYAVTAALLGAAAYLARQKVVIPVPDGLFTYLLPVAPDYAVYSYELWSGRWPWLMLPLALVLGFVPLLLAHGGRRTLRPWFLLERPGRRWMDPPSAAPAPAAPPAAPPERWDRLSIAALILGCCVFVPVATQIIAIILGARARSQSWRWTEGRRGRGLAHAGIIIAAVMLLYWATWLVAIALMPFYAH